ncbi:IPT/TIG domain-containing protein [Terriglobus aquaticus]|uniref:IPT/TIG domain-containing protein n=1 Tax=Terriglobus aquaticus TaxID=940139 RepID=A0ABW9KRG3_9BACT|nr:IPT/TIG domain-containing protein [Terriglobus aquaticus]
MLLLPVLRAAGPRWVASNGAGWQNDGSPITWYQNNVSYFIDAGPLSSSVSNAAATQIVNAAAQVWNIQYSNLVLSNGGSLNEDVSSSNVYLGSNGPIWPADVDSSNYAAKQIAVVFDADGTLIDMLLGSGASSPSACRQNAAVENVDKFIQPGNIAHAIILLNGRCTGPAPEQQLQMQYQLMRVFGRVIGLAWSQVNDNVFTGAPQPTYQQQLHWPIMHPIDIVCGTYTYQCLPNPFTLRDDDRCSVHLLYGLGAYASTDGEYLTGFVKFPTGEGMDGVNVTATRQGVQGQYGVEGWQTTSAVTGALYRRSSGNPVAGGLSGFPAVQGTLNSNYQGYWTMAEVPAIPTTSWNNVIVAAESVNPLYRGSYAVGPTSAGMILPSGTVGPSVFSVVGRYGAQSTTNIVSTASSDCSTGSDGTESAPATVAPSGMWSGKICGYGHTSWGSITVQAGRTATLEVIALDENNSASMAKMQPVLGLWHGSDPTGTRPTIAATGTAFNGRQNGTTQLTATFTTSETVRFVVADQRGSGRPDFAYSARLLYADSVRPARLGNNGGTVTITGVGFQPGNTVTVGGVAASVVSLSPTQIVVNAPTLSALNGNTTNDVVVSDLRTGGTSTITGGLLYGSSTGDVLTVVTAPLATTDVGAANTFAVRLTNSSNAPVAGVTITVRVTAGSATLAPCGATTCTVLTDGTGLARVQAAASAAGSITLLATTTSGAQASAQFSATLTSQSLSPVRPVEYIAATANAPFSPEVMVLRNGLRISGQPVQWTVGSGAVQLASTQNSAQSTSMADGSAIVSATGALAAGAQATVQACAWTNACTSLTLVGVSPDAFRLQGIAGDAQVVQSGSRLGAITLRVVDAAGNGVAGAAVSIRQQVTAWQPPCPATGRCAVPPVYGSAVTSAISDDDGLLSIAPMQFDGTAATTQIVAATGTSGFFSVSLVKEP